MCPRWDITRHHADPSAQSLQVSGVGRRSRGIANFDEHRVSVRLFRLAGRSIFVLHDLKTLRFDPVAAGIDVIISGHSHVPKIDEVDGVLYLNPGSAGRRRFRLPITLATIEIKPHALSPIIHDLVDR
jgi:predicted phosphodiesterase